MDVVILLILIAVGGCRGQKLFNEGEKIAPVSYMLNGEEVTGPFEAVIYNEALGQKIVTTYFIGEEGAIIEGDIIMPMSSLKHDDGTPELSGVGSAFEFSTWPDSIVPYVFEGDSVDRSIVEAAIAHWKKHTTIKLIPRTDEKDFVAFRGNTGRCSSSIGRVGGKQFINLDAGCRLGSVIHEIGHAVGLYHEQSRNDRDDHIAINWDNIKEVARHNFKASGSFGIDLGAYDFASIMHYDSFAFSENGQPTITKLDGSLVNANRSTLSRGDIAAISELYGELDKSRSTGTVESLLAEEIISELTATESCSFVLVETTESDERGNFTAKIEATLNSQSLGVATVKMSTTLKKAVNAAILNSMIPSFKFGQCAG